LEKEPEEHKDDNEKAEKFLDWFKTKLPQMILAFLQAVFNRMNALQNESDRKQLELDKRKAHDEIDKDAAERGPDALLDDAIRKGSRDSTTSDR
jgi:hypothetical protein